MLLSNLKNKTKTTDSLFSKIYNKAENDQKYKNMLTYAMHMTRVLPDANSAAEWINKMTRLNTQYKEDITVLKEEFRAHRIASLTNASVGIVGVANFWNPIGWGLMLGSGVSEVANVITEICISKAKTVDETIETLKNEFDDPFQSVSSDLSNFIVGYEILCYAIEQVVGKDNTQEMLSVFFGSMYLLNCHTDPKNIKKVWETWTICHTSSSVNINSSLQYVIDDSHRFRDYFIGNNILFGAGVSVISLCILGPSLVFHLVYGANRTMGLGLLFPKSLFTALRFASTIGKSLLGVTVVLSIFTLINDSIEIHKIDEKYEPYFQINRKIDKILDDLRTFPKELCTHSSAVKNYELLCNLLDDNEKSNQYQNYRSQFQSDYQIQPEYQSRSQSQSQSEYQSRSQSRSQPEYQSEYQSKSLSEYQFQSRSRPQSQSQSQNYQYTVQSPFESMYPSNQYNQVLKYQK